SQAGTHVGGGTPRAAARPQQVQQAGPVPPGTADRLRRRHRGRRHTAGPPDPTVGARSVRPCRTGPSAEHGGL
ncbi:MAG: hypothetical protein AVDCRST_MAG16-1805, partial [uncultured Frankineae bacterium]